MMTVKVGPRATALVDDEDYPLVSGSTWYAYRRARNRTTYAYRKRTLPDGRVKWEYMHSVITGFPETDHRNGNGLDNQRENLRPCTRTQNRANTPKQRGTYSSQYKGIHWDRNRNKWQAKIQVNGRSIYLGRYQSEASAARAYDVAARQHFGDFARLNFP